MRRLLKRVFESARKQRDSLGSLSIYFRVIISSNLESGKMSRLGTLGWSGNNEIARLRNQYDLHMRVERYVSDEAGIPSSDAKLIKD